MEVRLGGEVLINPWLGTGVCCYTLSGISFVKTWPRCEVRIVVLFI